MACDSGAALQPTCSLSMASVAKYVLVYSANAMTSFSPACFLLSLITSRRLCSTAEKMGCLGASEKAAHFVKTVVWNKFQLLERVCKKKYA